jgi:hypothetical protein
MGRRPNLDTCLGLIHNLRCRSSARCGEGCGGGRRQRDLLFWPTQDVRSIVENRPSVPDVYQSVNWTCAGICAHKSAIQGGRIVHLPVFKERHA